MNRGYILVVDDEPDIRRLVQEILEDEHYQVAVADNADGARALYQKRRPDMVLLDIWMPGTDGITLLKEWSQSGQPEIPVVMMSGHGTVETAVEATRLGAYDFIEKPVSMGKLLVTVERALAAERLRRENIKLKSATEPDSFLIGKSRSLARLREDVLRVAAADTWVLILGEPGSGRAAAARYLHYHSPRRDHPLVEVSLSAAPTQNVAIKLFGSEQDGTVAPGACEQAANGTLILNDIAELTAATQVQLLHALQEKRFMRVGGHAPLPMQARIIAISDATLADAVAEGRFREDLYYRLNVVPLEMPPLRKRPADVPLLVEHFIAKTCQAEDIPLKKVTPKTLDRLVTAPWPGNVRQLENAVEKAIALSGYRDTLYPADFGLAESHRLVALQPATPGPMLISEHIDFATAVSQFERSILQGALAKTGGNKTAAAELLGLKRTTLIMKLRGLDPTLGQPRQAVS